MLSNRWLVPAWKQTRGRSIAPDIFKRFSFAIDLMICLWSPLCMLSCSASSASNAWPTQVARAHPACRRSRSLLVAFALPRCAEYAADHDAAVARCLAQLFGYAGAPLPEDATSAAQLTARFGGLGLPCARADRHAAHWASWCDALPVVSDRAREVLQRILQALRAPEA